MPAAVETATALYLHGTEPAMTLASRPAQQRVRRIPKAFSPAGATFRAAPVVEGRASTAAEENVAAVETQLTQADMAIRQLLRMEQFDADWDGSGAARPLPSSLRDARAFIRALAPESVIPRPALHADGHAILFIRAPDKYAELEFLGDSLIGFYARRGGQEWADEIVFDGRAMPEGLSQIGFTI